MTPFMHGRRNRAALITGLAPSCLKSNPCWAASYSTMALTGHSSLGVYLLRIGKWKTAACSDCRAADSPNYIIFECSTIERLRKELQECLQALDSDTPRKWSTTSFAEAAFRTLKHSEVVMHQLTLVVPRWQYPGGYSRGWYSHARVEGKHHPWSYHPLDRVNQTEPSTHKDDSDAVYTPLLVQYSPPFA